MAIELLLPYFRGDYDALRANPELNRRDASRIEKWVKRDILPVEEVVFWTPSAIPVLAAETGRIALIHRSIERGRETDHKANLAIAMESGPLILYTHLDPAIPIEYGQHVMQGDEIGRQSTLRKYGVPDEHPTKFHMHFGVYRDNNQPPLDEMVRDPTWIQRSEFSKDWGKLEGFTVQFREPQ
ncbi:MAG: hypothetical protein Q7S65_00770 [Nanoarchaeota archaeon]|nr:hypothetical protein [Nanoarchaeota archaeon]